MRLLHKTPIWIQKLYPDFVWKIDTDRKELFLTFDDGPIPEVTDYVLDALKDHNAKATFFCVGENLTKYPMIAQRIIEEGHLVGNHTYNHLKGWETKNFTYWRNILRSQEVIQGLQVSTHLFRPPYGRIKRSQAAALKNYKVIMWNRLAWDFDKNLNVNRAIAHLTDDAPDGSIFVFHDNLKSFKNVKQILPAVLKHYSGQGYNFPTLTEDLFL